MAEPPRYYLTDLGHLGGGTARAGDINVYGEVVGTSRNAAGFDRAYLWRSGQMIELGVLPGETRSGAKAINDHGDVVGTSGIRAFFWRDGVMIEIPALDPNRRNLAEDISNDGFIVGSSFDTDGIERGYFWDSVTQPSRPKVLQVPSGILTSNARGINRAGEIAMNGDDGVNNRESWRSDGSTFDILPDLGNGVFAMDISDSGAITGYGFDSKGLTVGFIWTPDGQMQSIAPLGGFTDQYKYGISSSDVCVGLSERFAGGVFEYEATVYLPDLRANFNLEKYADNLGTWQLTNAVAVNEGGQIVGNGRPASGADIGAYLLTPVPTKGFVLAPHNIDDRVYVLEPKYGTILGSFPVDEATDFAWDIVDGYNGNLLLSGTIDGVFELSPRGQLIRQFAATAPDSVYGIARSLAGYTVGASREAGLLAWNASGQSVQTGLSGDFIDVVLFNLPNVKRYVINNVARSNVQAYDLDVRFRGQTASVVAWPTQVTLMSGLRFAVGSFWGEVFVFSMRDGSLLNTIFLEGFDFNSQAVFQSDEDVLLIGSSSGVAQYRTDGTVIRHVSNKSGFTSFSQCANYRPR